MTWYSSSFFKWRTYSFLFKRGYRFSNVVALGLSIFALVSSFSTYIVLTGASAETNQKLIPFVYVNIFLLLSLAIVIAKRLVELWIERKKSLAGSKLYTQLVGLFAFVSIAPAIIVFVFSTFYLNSVVQAWFGEPVRAAIDEAGVVAEAYLKDHADSIFEDARAIVWDLRPSLPRLLENPELFSEELTHQGKIRNLPEILVFNEKKQVINRSQLAFSLEFEKVEWAQAFEYARNNLPYVVIPEDAPTKNRVRALVLLDPITDTYLYVGRMLNPTVLDHHAKTKSAIANYNRLEQQRSSLQVIFILFFSLITLLLLLSAMWLGLTLSNILMRPITQLIRAAERVSEGDLGVTIDSEPSHNEIDTLTHAFNHMTSQLSRQREDLIRANAALDQRRQFIESVLAGVSAGIMGIDKNGILNLCNHRAGDLLSVDPALLRGHTLEKTAPEIEVLLQEALATPKTPLNKQIMIMRQGFTRILQVCVVVENGYVVTFDDVTLLLAAQKNAAWSDVARKIAHEIKNPLTPIQLSAERLKRRYLKEIQNDPETFRTCIDTIVRQVRHIGTLVSEFSSFARMPVPVLNTEDMVELCSQALFLQKEAHPELHFILNVPSQPVYWKCDQQQIGQALTNLLQNAINAIFEQPHRESQGCVRLTLLDEASSISILLEDNGPGLSPQGRERLTEPYYTTRRKGTGLGLAIVAKVIEDHRGKLILGDSEMGGALISLVFPQGIAKSTFDGVNMDSSNKQG